MVNNNFVSNSLNMYNTNFGNFDWIYLFIRSRFCVKPGYYLFLIIGSFNYQVIQIPFDENALVGYYARLVVAIVWGRNDIKKEGSYKPTYKLCSVLTRRVW